MQNYIMKNLLAILILLPMLFSCSSDDNDVQDYTSFVIVNNSEINMPNCVIGYKKGGVWIKISELGNLQKGTESKEIILNEHIEEPIFVFTDYISPRKLDVPFTLKKNIKNKLSFPLDVRGIIVSNKEDATQYPQ